MDTDHPKAKLTKQKTKEAIMSQNVVINYTDPITDKITPIKIPLTSAAWSAMETAGFVGSPVGAAVGIAKFFQYYNQYCKKVDGAIADVQDTKNFSNSFYSDAVKSAFQEADLPADATDEELSTAMDAALDTAAEAVDEAAADTVEVPFADIAIAAVGLALSLAAGIVSLIEAVKEKNQTTLVFKNSIPNTYLKVVPTTAHGSWFKSNDSSGNAIGGSDSDKWISDLKIPADDDSGGIVSFSQVPTGRGCVGALIVSVYDSNTDAYLAGFIGSFDNPVVLQVSKSTYSMSSNVQNGCTALEPIISTEYDDAIVTSLDAKRKELLHDIAIFEFVKIP